MIAVMIAGAVATLVSLLGTRFLIVFFRTRGRGQPILGKEDHGPEHHMHKQGTPTMGGLLIILAATIAFLPLTDWTLPALGLFLAPLAADMAERRHERFNAGDYRLSF